MIHKAKKSLGQNFLKSEIALRTMCSAGEVNEKDIVLEIGPGKGALTSKLLPLAKKVIAVEKDENLFEFLKEKFKKEIENKKLILLNEDILDFNFSLPLPGGGLGRGQTPSAVGISPLVRGRENPTYKIIANIPYNITGAIFKKFLSNDFQPKTMILLVQKEVAERIIARPAKGGAHDMKESILSLSVKAYGTPKYIMKVHKRFFTPQPKVDSAILAILNISKENFKEKVEEENFFKIIKAGFAHKRKILRKNLESSEIELQKIDKVFQKLKIDPKSRAEDINFEKWLEISHFLSTDF